MARDMKPPKRAKGKRKKITTKGKPGDTGPWGANPARDRYTPPPKLDRGEDGSS